MAEKNSNCVCELNGEGCNCGRVEVDRDELLLGCFNLLDNVLTEEERLQLFSMFCGYCGKTRNDKDNCNNGCDC